LDSRKNPLDLLKEAKRHQTADSASYRHPRKEVAPSAEIENLRISRWHAAIVGVLALPLLPPPSVPRQAVVAEVLVDTSGECHFHFQEGSCRQHGQRS
jgi:hypothetical protein